MNDSPQIFMLVTFWCVPRLNSFLTDGKQQTTIAGTQQPQNPTLVCSNMNKTAIDSVKYSKEVKFLNYNSEEEARRTARGPLYRERLEEQWKQKQMAARVAQQRELAGRTYDALIREANEADVDRLFQNDQFFGKLFGELVTEIIAEPLFQTVQQHNAQARAANQNLRTAQFLRYTRDDGVAFAQIARNNNLVFRLSNIGGYEPFHGEFVGTRQLSSDEDEEERQVGRRDDEARANGPRQDAGLAQIHARAPQNVRSALEAIGFSRDQINDCLGVLGDRTDLIMAVQYLVGNLSQEELPPAARSQRQRRLRDVHDENTARRTRSRMG